MKKKKKGVESCSVLKVNSRGGGVQRALETKRLSADDVVVTVDSLYKLLLERERTERAAATAVTPASQPVEEKRKYHV